MGSCGSKIQHDKKYVSNKSQYKQPRHVNKNEYKQPRKINKQLNIRTYLLLSYFVRNAGIFVPSDIFFCLYKYCARSKYKSDNDVKIWVFSWNMSCIKDDISTEELEQIIPVDYDLYVFGVQDAVTNSFFDSVSAYFCSINIGNKVSSYNWLKTPHSDKHTGIYVYCRTHLAEHIGIRFKRTISESDGELSSNKGGACLILNVYSTTMLLMSIDITEYNAIEKLMTKYHNKFGEKYQHILVFGTFGDECIKSRTETPIYKLTNGNALDIWKYDPLTQMLRSLKCNNSSLKSLNEPKPMIDFYPTYPKNKNRKFDFVYNRNKTQKLLLSEISKVYEINNQMYDNPISFSDRILYGTYDSVIKSVLTPELIVLSNSFNEVSDNYLCDKYNCISNYLMQSKHSPMYCGMILVNNKQMKKIKLTIHAYNGHYTNYDEYHPKNLLDGSKETQYTSKSGTRLGDWITFKMETNSRIKPTKIRIINYFNGEGINALSLFIGSNTNWFPLCPKILNIRKSMQKQEWLICDKLFLSDYFLSTNKLNLVKIVFNNHGGWNTNTFYSFDLFGVEYD